MTPFSPELAEKVLSAEIRNLVKKVGDGGTLSTTDRQIFLTFCQQESNTDDLKQIRVNALLRKWLDGGRLSREERDEIAHILPDATSITVETVPLPQQSDAITLDEAMSRYAISRAKYFRWKQLGLAVPEGPDPPPYEDAAAMVSWYERMKARGIFKHRCPRALHDAARGRPHQQQRRGDPPPQPDRRAPASQPGGGPPLRQLPERRGFLIELEEIERHAAQIREDYMAAYAVGDQEKGDLLKAQYFEIIELLRKYTKDKEAIGIAEGELVRKADVEQDLAAIVPSIFANLLQLAMPLYAECRTQMAFEEFSALFVAKMSGAFIGIEKSGFAPPLSLAA